MKTPLLLSLLLSAPLVAQSQSLTTTFASNNGHSGNMFEVTASNTVTIFSFDGNFSSSTADVEIWYRQGSYVGFEGSNVGWTSAGTANFVTNGTDTPTPIPISIGLTIGAGETWSFYMQGINASVRYTNGTLEGAIFVSDNNLSIHEGIGTDGTFGGSIFSPRVWNGTIHYDSGSSGSPFISVTNLVAGQTATVSLSNGTPSTIYHVLYSFAGGGPTQTAFGIADLTPPVAQLVPLIADPNGKASFSATVPPFLIGWPIWLQGLDTVGAVWTNSLSRTIG